ncbi:MAG: protein lplB [Paenibacillaceae bacterium]|jgi:putative aldouronate transport system permease protein|nr:protein lplB [Paenibacillaceae bacterium]
MKSSAALTVQERRHAFWQAVLRDKYLYLMLLPGLVYFIVFKYVPIYGIVIAFQKFNIFKGIWNSEWVGLEVFRQVFASPDFWMVLRNTILISLYKIMWGFPVPIALAILINEMAGVYFKKIIQTILYLPHFISWVVIYGVILAIMSPNEGLLGWFYDVTGLPAKNILADPSYFRSILVASDVWKEMGWSSIIYLAAITQVDQAQYESATIDGANRWHKIWHITLPAIRNVIIVLLILKIGSLMHAGFEQVLVMQNSAVRSVSEIFDTYVYQFGLRQGNYSFATAIGLFNSVVALILILLAQWVSKLFGEEGLL